MKAILYFVAAGVVREAHRTIATNINAATGKKVVFRNGTITDEKPEPNEGVAGEVPPQYSTFPRYDDAGKLVAKGTAPAPESGEGEAPGPITDERKLNAIGLPDGEGCPEDREALKEALDAEGIEYHANAKTEKLVELYLAHFYPESGEGEGDA